MRGYLPFDEVAEFYMIYLGFKHELRELVIAEMRRTNQRYLSLSQLFELASQAEASYIASLFPRTWERLYIQNKGNISENIGRNYVPVIHNYPQQFPQPSFIQTHHRGG